MAEPWWEGRMAALDLETTAADPEEARVVSAAIAYCGGGEATETWTAIADPGVEIPEEAAAVHGITTQRAREDGRPAELVVADIIDLLTMALARRRSPLIVFNARYDLTVLDREARRYGMGPLSERQIEVRVVDPFVLDKWLDRYRKGSRKLAETCAHYGATLDAAHDASYDAVAAARLAWVIGAKGRVVRRADWPAAAAEKAECERRWDAVRGDLELLHAFQVEEAAEQARGLAEHFVKQGQYEDAERVRGEWPFVPFEASAQTLG